MRASSPQSIHAGHKVASTTSIVLAFFSVYFFWGSTYTAIRVGALEMPALLLAGTRFLVAGVILLGWCRWRGMRIQLPAKTMMMQGLIGLLLLCGGNVGLVYAEKTLPSGLASLAFAITPVYVALIEMALPRGEANARAWMVWITAWFCRTGALLWPSLHYGIWRRSRASVGVLGALLAGAFSWAVGSLLSRHARLNVNTFVAASWQMVIAGAIDILLGTVLGQWPQFHLNGASIGSLA